MTATLSTRMEIPQLGPGEIEVEVDYSYSPRYRELVIVGSAARVEGKETPIWHLLTQMQKLSIEDECVQDYTDRMDQAVVDNREFRNG